MIFNSGGVYSIFEKDLETRLVPLLISLGKEEEKLSILLARAIDTKVTSSKYWNIIRYRIKLIYKEMDTLFSAWSEVNIPRRYETSLKEIQRRITHSSIVDKSLKSITEMLNSNISAQQMKLLYADANTVYQSALIAGQTNLIKFTRLTQQTLLSERLINQTIGEGIITGNLRKSAEALTGQLWSKLLGNIEDLQFVQAGKFKYKPRYYAELVSRVKFHEAHTYATMNQANNYGTDLVQISSHNTQTAICVPFEGKVYSISGKSTIFPPLFDTPPYHPNCLHLMYPTFESGMKADGTYNDYAAFSNNEVNKPPVPSNFIPVEERNIA